MQCFAHTDAHTHACDFLLGCTVAYRDLLACVRIFLKAPSVQLQAPLLSVYSPVSRCSPSAWSFHTACMRTDAHIEMLRKSCERVRVHVSVCVCVYVGVWVYV